MAQESIEIGEHKPKRKLGCWWFLVPPVILFMLFIVQMWGPSPSILVSPKTTRIETHLGPDGVPQYTKYINEKLRKGTTPENNAALLYWTALWPGELRGNVPHQEAVCEALGMDMPVASEALVDMYGTPKEEFAIWIKENLLNDVQATSPQERSGEAVASADGEFEDVEDPDELASSEGYGEGYDAEYVAQQAQRDLDSLAGEMALGTLSSMLDRPWTSKQAPPLGRWAKENQLAIDRLVEGAAKPEYYSPSPNLLDGSDESMVMMLLPGVQMLRTGARALACRAMWHVGEGRPEEAWRDLQACHRMARHTMKGSTLVEQLVGVAIDAIASNATQALLHHGDLSPELARKILRDLDELSYLPDMSRSIDEGERLMFLDTVTRVATGKMGLDDLQGLIGGVGQGSPMSGLRSLRVDWNVVLENGNEWYDRMVEVARQDRFERRAAEEKLDADLQKLSPGNNPSLLAGSLVSVKARSELVSDIMMGLFLPAVTACNEASDRSKAIHDMNRIIAALAIYRAESGEYPDELEPLTPKIMESLPLDVYSGKPYLYKKTDDGFLLYSVFRNGVDDGGTGFEGKVVNGERVANGAPGNQDKSDWVILLPMPDFKVLDPED